MDPRLPHLLEAAQAARDHASADLARHRRRMADIAEQIKALREETEPTDPTAYAASGASASRARWRHRRICELNMQLADLRATAEALENASALATARAEVVARLSRGRTR